MSLERQLEREARMVQGGIARYHAAVAAAEQAGRGEETPAAVRLVTTHVQAVADAIAEWSEKIRVRAARRPAAWECIIAQPPLEVAYIGLQTLFAAWSQGHTEIAAVADRIGQRLEDEQRFSTLAAANPEYVAAIKKDWVKKGTTAYRHKHRVVHKVCDNVQDGWQRWGAVLRVAVGSVLIEAVENSTELVRCVRKSIKHKDAVHVEPSEELRDWVQGYNDRMQLLYPLREPCVHPPADWVDGTTGGYWSPEMQRRTPFIMQSHRHAPPEPAARWLAAANRLQRVPYRINRQVLCTLLETASRGIPAGFPSTEKVTPPACPFPPGLRKEDMTPEQEQEFLAWKRDAATAYTAEKRRFRAVAAAARCLRVAQEAVDEPALYFVHQADFRGRLYVVAQDLSPQGPDLQKGLLQRVHGEPLTERGWYWFRVQGANLFGWDKAEMDDRAARITERAEEWLAVADDPVQHWKVWAGADSPVQFLAWCFDFAGATRDPQFIVRTKVDQDGSCNGLQHYSAMLRDPVGAQATNLMHSEHGPADIYSNVGAVAVRIMRNAPTENTRVVLDVIDRQYSGKLPRNVCKPPVMTMPYGSSQRTCSDTTMAFMQSDMNFAAAARAANAPLWGLASDTSTAIWAAIGHVVVSARAGMKFLRQCAGVWVKNTNAPLEWTTPGGWVVRQTVPKLSVERLKTHLSGGALIRVSASTDTLCPHGMRNATAPNFVHSMDATHQVMTIERLPDDIEFSSVHDSFAVHPNYVDVLSTAIRESFVDLYSGDALADLREQWRIALAAAGGDPEDLPAVPAQGGFDLQNVLASRYFFS